MPKSKYFDGKGQQVFESMVKENGKEAGTREFYATINKQKQKKRGVVSAVRMK